MYEYYRADAPGSRPRRRQPGPQARGVVFREPERLRQLEDPLEVSGSGNPRRRVGGVIDHRLHPIAARGGNPHAPLAVEAAVHFLEAVQRRLVFGSETPEHAVDRSARCGHGGAVSAGRDAEGVAGEPRGFQPSRSGASPGHLGGVHVGPIGEVLGHLGPAPWTSRRSAGITDTRRIPCGRSRLSSRASRARTQSGLACPWPIRARPSVPISASRPSARAAGKASLASGAVAATESISGARAGHAANASESRRVEPAVVAPVASASVTRALNCQRIGGSGRAASATVTSGVREVSCCRRERSPKLTGSVSARSRIRGPGSLPLASARANGND